MATTLNLAGQEFKQRNIFGVWLGLPLITLGIYHLVWYWKINDEARRYLGDQSINPWMSLLALTLGSLIVVPPFVSVYNTGRRVRAMEDRAGTRDRIEPVLSLILVFVAGTYVLYLQAHLNGIWEMYLRPGGSSSHPTVPPPPAP